MVGHECMSGEHRCAYCGTQIRPYNCNGCGRFMSAERMHQRIWRCEGCE